MYYYTRLYIINHYPCGWSKYCWIPLFEEGAWDETLSIERFFSITRTFLKEFIDCCSTTFCWLLAIVPAGAANEPFEEFAGAWEETLSNLLAAGGLATDVSFEECAGAWEETLAIIPSGSWATDVSFEECAGAWEEETLAIIPSGSWATDVPLEECACTWEETPLQRWCVMNYLIKRRKQWY